MNRICRVLNLSFTRLWLSQQEILLAYDEQGEIQQQISLPAAIIDFTLDEHSPLWVLLLSPSGKQTLQRLVSV